VLLATVVEVEVIYRYAGGARVCCFCSDCCRSFQHLSRMVNLSQFTATH